MRPHHTNLNLLTSTTVVALALVCLVLGVSLVLLSMAHQEASRYDIPHPGEASSGDFLTVQPLSPGIWVHTSWRYMPGVAAPVPSNGLIVQENDSLWIVDTASGSDLTTDLLDWIDTEIRLPVRGAVASHFHDDAMGGTSVLEESGIPTWAHPLTIRLAEEHGPPSSLLPLPALVRGEAVRLAGGIEIFYPGPGHSPDNIMAWIERQGVLFAGPAVRPVTARSLGHTEAADLLEWAEAIGRTIDRYREARVVVPSHSPLGGPDLLTHTLNLLGDAR